MLIKGEVEEMPPVDSSSIPGPAMETRTFLPGLKGKATVESSPLKPMSCGINLGSGFDETKNPSDVALSANTGINWVAAFVAMCVRNGGVVSNSPAYEP